jgi:arylsulfatase A-like enzyme
LPAILNRAGYRTHAAGKLHLRSSLVPPGADVSGDDPRLEPECAEHWKQGRITRMPDNYYGFEHWDGTLGHGKYTRGEYRTWLDSTHPDAARALDKPMPQSDQVPWWELDIDPELHYNAWIADRSIDFLDSMAGGTEPFFLWCSFPDPHAPFAGLPDYADRYRDAEIRLPPRDEEIDPSSIPASILELAGGEDGFRTAMYRNGGDNLRDLYVQTFAMINHIDDQVGRVLAALERNSQADNTVVAFLSDHGDLLGEHGLMHKGYWPYDGCCRVPMIVRSPWAGVTAKTVRRPVGLIDFVPTILDWAGVAPPDDPLATTEFVERARTVQPVLPGESLRPVVETDALPERGHALIEFDDDLNPYVESVQMRVLVTESHKLCYYRQTGQFILFDRLKDPGETNNVYGAAGYERVSQEMLERLVFECLRTEARMPRRVVGF